MSKRKIGDPSLFDPVITSANVSGNGAFAKGIDNIVNCFNKKEALA